MFIVKTTITKPEGTEWYRTNSAAEVQALSEWIRTQSGIVQNRTRRLGNNTRVNTLVFTDQAAADAFQAAIATNPTQQARQAYGTDNGFTRVVRKYQVVE